MTAVVEIQYQNSNFTANTSTITITNGEFALTFTEFLQFEGNFSFNALNISTGTIAFYNVSAGTPVNGTVSIPVTGADNGIPPQITVNNFSGTVTVNWPSADGPQYQQLSPGDPMTLTDFVG